MPERSAAVSACVAVDDALLDASEPSFAVELAQAAIERSEQSAASERVVFMAFSGASRVEGIEAALPPFCPFNAPPPRV